MFSEDYRSSFHAWLTSGVQTVNAALYEGSNPAGGYAVPITVDDQIVTLAPQETAIRQLATVLPTTNDIRVPRQISFYGGGTESAIGSDGKLVCRDGPLARFRHVVRVHGWQLDKAALGVGG